MTFGPQQAPGAERVPAAADERPEIEHRPVHLKPALAPHQTKSERAQRPCAVRLGAVAWSEEATQEAGHIDIEERLGSPVHNGQHRARRVGADTRQALQLLARAGYDAAIHLDQLCEPLEGKRLLPPEPEWLERVLEAFGGGMREGGPRWVAIDEPAVGPGNPGRGRPLQEDFRHNDFVRLPARLAPGKGAAVSREPGEEPPAQPGERLDHLGRDLMWRANWLSHQAQSLS